MIPEPCETLDEGPIVRLDTFDDERLDKVEAHLRAQDAILHERCDAIRGALVVNSDRLTDFERSLQKQDRLIDELFARLNLLTAGPCSLCRGDGCSSPTCRATPPPPAE